MTSEKGLETLLISQGWKPLILINPGFYFISEIPTFEGEF